ncbi:MAG TPA: hypothetical protein VGE12_07395 [Noviherbaspirillum sp.]
MDAPDILAQIKSTETADIDPETVAEIYAYAIALMESYITETDFRRLVLLGAAMYRNSTKGAGAELQMPQSSTADADTIIGNGNGFLQ